jgi:hypothetical protein
MGKPPLRIHAFAVFHHKTTLAPPHNLNFDGQEFHTLALNYEIVNGNAWLARRHCSCSFVLPKLSHHSFGIRTCMGLSTLRIGWGSDLRVQKMSTIIMRF